MGLGSGFYLNGKLMSKAAKINHLIEQHRLLIDSVLPDLIKIHHQFNQFEGLSLDETKTSLKIVISIIEKLIAENKLNSLSFNSLNAITSSAGSVHSTFTQLKHSLDQNSFQSFSVNLDSCLQQIQMYATPALFSEEYNLINITNETNSLRNDLVALQQQGNTVQSDINALIKNTDIKISETNKVFDEATVNLKEKEKTIDNLLDAVSSKTIASSFDESAKQEKRMADWLRYSSIFCMTLIVVVFGIAIIETSKSEFDWKLSLFRIGIAFALSIPTAYLARESAKHRQQHYNHLQTSLNLKAIHPFLASLPPEEQHKIKADIANKIFSPKENLLFSNDSMPVNIQELLMALLNLNKK